MPRNNPLAYGNTIDMQRAHTAEQQRLMGGADMGAQRSGDALGAQQNALAMYQDAAMGNGPSVAQQQLQAGADQAMKQQMAMAAMGRGGNLGAGLRQATAAGAGIAMDTNQQAAQLRAAEQQAAMQGMAGMANTMQGQAMQHQMGMEGLLAQRRAQMEGANLQAGMGAHNIRQDNRQFGMQLGQQIAGGLGGLAMFSDRRLKKDVEDGSSEVRSALAALSPASWEYKSGKHGRPGRHLGVMAQDLERSAAGKRIVTDTPEGKTVDVGGMSALALAGVADMQRRLDALEGGK